MLLLGFFNILIVLNKNSIEVFMANLLEAEKVSIGSVSNLPLVFISGAEFEIKVNDELSLRVEGIYIHYRFLKIFTRNFEQILKEVQIENIVVRGHKFDIQDYQKKLQTKFAEKAKNTTPVNTQELLEQLQFEVNIKNISFTLNVMTQFWYKLDVKGMNLAMKSGEVSWKALVNVNGQWSNTLLLADTQLTTEGMFNDLQSLTGFANINIKHLNLGGLPIIRSNVIINSIFSNGVPTFALNDLYKTNDIVFINQKDFLFSLHRTFDIKYADFEESNLLDYVFKPGTWNFNFSAERKKEWIFNLNFSSPQHPSYGLSVFIDSEKNHKLYAAIVNLQTHYFGSIKADLLIPIRKGLYPLPRGKLELDNVRFILSGLIFSGNGIAELVPNRNEIDLTAFDVKMNGGLIGNTAVKFEFTPEGMFNIYPKYLAGNALEVSASIGRQTVVNLKALDIDGDFVAQNIKIPIFGIKDSRYKGSIDMFKKDRFSPFFLNGYIKGFLDDVEQVDAIVSIENEKINIPRFHIINPDILLDGNIFVAATRSNTIVTIMANGSFNSNENIPIEIGVNIQQNNAIVSGLVDDQIKVKTITKDLNTDFTVLFDKYPLKKLGVNGFLDAYLVMGFDTSSITRFSIQEGIWNIDNRKITLDFDAQQNTNTGLLDTSYLTIGLDKDNMDAYGYFSFLDSSFSGAFRFDRGGSFQFQLGRYVVKSQISIKDLIVENMLDFDVFDRVSFLKTEETETVLLDLDTTIEGVWSDLLYKGSVNIDGEYNDTFRVAVANFVVSNTGVVFTDFRLRHSRMNLDSDVSLSYQNDNLSSYLTGSITLDNIFKTDFEFDYTVLSNQGQLNYKIPNLYFLSKKPMQLSGQIFHNTKEFLLISDNIHKGLMGIVITDNKKPSWDISFISDSMKFVSEGALIQNNIQATLNWDVLLNKLSLGGDVRKVKGNMGLYTTISGALDNPIVNGELVGQDINVTLKSLRNTLKITNKQIMYISNNQINIPDITINATGGGTFGLDGFMSIQNQTIGTTDIRFYSKEVNASDKVSFLNWNLEVPYLFIKGKTYINNINLSGTIDDLDLVADISTENLNLGLELKDTLKTTSSTPERNPLLGLVSILNLDINIDLKNKSRFLNQLFDLEFEQQNPIAVEGNIGDGTVVFTGDFNIEKGRVSYLSTDLNVSSGVMQFSGDQGDPFPYISLNTETHRNSKNELIDVFVSFAGKLPDFELSQISSAPAKSRSELLNLLGFGSIEDTRTSSSSSSAQDLIASGVEVAENALFTTPLARRIQRLIPIDTFQIKTDVLGNLTRSVNNGSGNAVTGLSILHGSELEMGQYLPRIAGLQFKYNLKLESPDNSSLDSSSLNQIHKAGLEWSSILPYNWQGGVGVSVLGEVKPSTQNSFEPGIILEGSLKKRF